MIEFIRGLPTPNRFHIVTQGTDTFNGATRIATLFETAQTFGQDDSTLTLQQQGTSVKEQNFNIVDSKIQCVYANKDSHHISECHHRKSSNHRRQHPYSAQWNRAQHCPLTDKLTNPGLCIIIFCVSIVMAQDTLQVIIIGDKYNNLNCRSLIIVDPISRNRAIRFDQIIIINPVKISKLGRMFTRATDNQLSKNGTFQIHPVTDTGKPT